MKNSKSLLLTESGIMLACATILSMIEIVSLPYGGSVTLFSMLPVILIAYRRGIGWGLFTAFAFSLLQMLLGVNNLSYGTSAATVPRDNNTGLYRRVYCAGACGGVPVFKKSGSGACFGHPAGVRHPVSFACCGGVHRVEGYIHPRKSGAVVFLRLQRDIHGSGNNGYCNRRGNPVKADRYPQRVFNPRGGAKKSAGPRRAVFGDC